MRESLVQMDAAEQNAVTGFIFVDLSEEKEVEKIYFEADHDKKVYRLDAASKLQVVVSNEDGVNYHDISGQDIFDRKNDSQGPLYAGMKAIVPEVELFRLLYMVGWSL